MLHNLCQAGLKLLTDDGNVLKCWDDRLDAIYHAELGASAAILRAGFNLDCLLQRCGAPAALHVLLCTLRAPGARCLALAGAVGLQVQLPHAAL